MDLRTLQGSPFRMSRPGTASSSRQRQRLAHDSHVELSCIIVTHVPCKVDSMSVRKCSLCMHVAALSLMLGADLSLCNTVPTPCCLSLLPPAAPPPVVTSAEQGDPNILPEPQSYIGACAMHMASQHHHSRPLECTRV